MRAVAFILATLTAACAGVERAPSRESAQSGAQQQPGVVAIAPAASSAPSSRDATQVVEAEREAVAARPAPSTITPSAAPSAAKSEPPAAKAPAKTPAPAPAAAVAPSAKKETPPPAAKKPDAPAPLDLASLETRLKETPAIGLMTKITLKNQIDDLLGQFRAFHQGRLKTTLAELRKSFDLVVLKVLSLLQDGDSSLAKAIVASREAIWGILADPVKFANLAML